MMEKKEEERSIEEQGEGDQSESGGGNGGSVVEMEDAEVEVILASEIDLKPIEHPPEPPDEDQPIKCPIPDPLSLIVEEVFQEPCAESLQTIAQLLDQQQEASTEKLTGTVESEKHQTPLPDHATTCTTPTQKSPHQKLLQVFQQCKELHV